MTARVRPASKTRAITHGRATRRSNPRLREKASFDPKPHEVWPFKGDLGFRRSIESAGTVAAPLLAGFSFTLLVLLLPTLGQNQTTIQAGADVRVVNESQDFSALSEPAAVSLLFAGLMFIFSVQAAIAMRFHAHTPAELQEWFPEYFREGVEGVQTPPDVPGLAGWHEESAPAISAGKRWYGGWPREHLFNELLMANRWGRRARQLYHYGIAALLLGLAFLVTPPGGEGSLGRWALLAVAVTGVLVELAWIIDTSRPGKLAALITRPGKPTKPDARGGP